MRSTQVHLSFGFTWHPSSPKARPSRFQVGRERTLGSRPCAPNRFPKTAPAPAGLGLGLSPGAPARRAPSGTRGLVDSVGVVYEGCRCEASAPSREASGTAGGLQPREGTRGWAGAALLPSRPRPTVSPSGLRGARSQWVLGCPTGSHLATRAPRRNGGRAGPTPPPRPQGTGPSPRRTKATSPGTDARLYGPRTGPPAHVT